MRDGLISSARPRIKNDRHKKKQASASCGMDNSSRKSYDESRMRNSKIAPRSARICDGSSMKNTSLREDHGGS